MTPGSGGDTACHSTSGHTAALTYKTYHITIITCSYCIAYCILWPPIDLTWYCTINVEQAHYTEEVIAEVGAMRAAGGQEAGVTVSRCYLMTTGGHMWLLTAGLGHWSAH